MKTRTPLRDWIETSEYKSVRNFANAFGFKLKTAEDWAYGRANPSQRNRQMLFSITGIEVFAPVAAAPRAGLPVQVGEKVEEFRYRLSLIVETMEWFFDAPRSAREALRQTLNRNLDRFYTLVRAITSEKARQLVIQEGGVPHGSSQTGNLSKN